MAATGGRSRCMMDGLPEDDVLQEVLSRVGNVKALFMLAVTCRRWLRRFTDPSFLRTLWGVGHRARLLGFFFQRKGCERTSPTFLPAPLSPKVTSFDDGTFKYGKPLAARRGILLMQLTPRTFGLSNPITGERHILPPLGCSDDDVSSYAIITAADSIDLDGTGGRGLVFLQLLLTTVTQNYKVCLHSYYAAMRSWSAPHLTEDKITNFSPVGEISVLANLG